MLFHCGRMQSSASSASAYLPSASLMKALPAVTNVASLTDLPYLSDVYEPLPDLPQPPDGFVWIPPAPVVPAASSGGKFKTVSTGGFNGNSSSAASPVKSFSGPNRSFVPMTSGNATAGRSFGASAGASSGGGATVSSLASRAGASAAASAPPVVSTPSSSGSMFKKPVAATAQAAAAPPPPPPPPPAASLPEGWMACKDEQGAEYYYNTNTGESTWELPA